MKTLPSQRHLFDIPDDIAYFNCAYNAPQLNASYHHLLQGVAEKNHPWQRRPEDFFAPAERVRQLASGLFGGDRDGWAIVPSASYGMSAAARAVEPQLEKGHRILLLANAFPSEYLPWERSARERGTTIKTVPTPKDGDWTDALVSQIDKTVKAVVIPHCHWTDGSRLQLEDIAQVCRDNGTLVAIDATQSLGALPLDIETIAPDFLVAAGYKWLLAPYGFSLFWVAPEWREVRPLEESWLARENAYDFTRLADYPSQYQPGARRFDMGEKSIPTLLPGAIAALEQLTEWGIPAISETLGKINSRIIHHLENLGFSLTPEKLRSPHLFGVSLEHFDQRRQTNLNRQLESHRIYLSRRAEMLRFSPHLHINDNDCERLLTVLERTLS